MELIPWKDEYLTGVEDIDRQHKDFLKLINRLTIVHEHADRKEFAQRLLTEIGKYAEYHFTSEENIMYLTAYPGLARRHSQHLDLLESFSARMHVFRRGECGVEDFLTFLGAWFARHTVEEDRKIGEHVRGMKK